MEYQQIAAACFVPRLVRWLVFLRDCLCLEWCGCGVGGLVFGTLLGPEATGPWHGRCFPFFGGVRVVVWDLCFWFPGCIDHAWLVPFVGAGVWGVWYGVVV